MRRLATTPMIVAGVLSCALASSPSGRNEAQTADEPAPPWAVRGRIGVTSTFVDVNGSREKYRSDINDLPGGSLSEFQFELFRGPSDTKWLDYLTIGGRGFGDSAPYEEADLSFGKRGRYEFRGRYWKQDYFFSLPSYALTGLSENSARRSTDLSLRFFPTRGLTVEAGYLRQRQFGTAFSSSEDFTRLFELVAPRRSMTQDFRFGFSYRRPRTYVSVFQNFRRFKEDVAAGENRLLEPGQLPDLNSNQPVRGSIPSTRIQAKYEPSDQWTLEGSYRVSLGRVDAFLSRFLSLQLSEGLALEEIVRSVSRSERPDHRVKAGAIFSPRPWLAVSNRFEFHDFEVGGDLLQEIRLGSPIPGAPGIEEQIQSESFFDLRFFRYQPTVDVVIHPRLTLFAGYRLVDRRIEQIDPARRHETTSHSALGGALWRPYRGSRVRFELELGNSDDAFTRTEPRDVTRWRASARLPVGDAWSLGAHLLLSDRESKQEESRFNSDQRQGGIDVTFAPGENLSVTGAYSLLDLETSTDILFFVSGRQNADTSIFKTRLHLGNARVNWRPSRLLQFRVGYMLLKDPSDSSFPLNRHVGEAGITLQPKGAWSWDLEWRHVSYNETFSALQDYTANLLALSLQWSFGEW